MTKDTRKKQWDTEYDNPELMTRDTKPQKHVLRFLKWMKKKKRDLLNEDSLVLDMGCGLGRNIAYINKKFISPGIGYDISASALAFARKNYSNKKISFNEKNIGTRFDTIADGSVSLVLDVTTSHMLSARERTLYISELARIIIPGGMIYFRTLAREGDTNAKKLLLEFPGTEDGTYIHPILKTQERVFTRKDIFDLYGEFFNVVYSERSIGYQKVGNQSYKRNYWEVYLERK